MRKFNKVAVVGAGAWGSALSVILSKNVPEVSVWAREKEVVESVRGRGENSVFLPPPFLFLYVSLIPFHP